MPNQPPAIFNKLAVYYDCIYSKKEYDHEVSIIDKELQLQLSQSEFSLLDIGCGTGEHCLRFSKLGYSVTGLDQSPAVLEIAKQKARTNHQDISFILDDARNFSLATKFKAIVCLFHVTSYLTSNEDLTKFFSTVAKHLSNDGVFIFDCWYGPGVLSSKPETQYKQHPHDSLTIHRIKVPRLMEESNMVEVRHTIFAVNDAEKKVEYPFTETHQLRYFFYPELELLLTQAGLEIVKWGNMLNNFSEVTGSEWDVGFVVKKKS